MASGSHGIWFTWRLAHGIWHLACNEATCNLPILPQVTGSAPGTSGNYGMIYAEIFGLVTRFTEL